MADDITDFHTLFHGNFTQLQQRYGVNGQRHDLYMGWMPPMTRRAARRIARKLARSRIRALKLGQAGQQPRAEAAGV